VFIAEGRSNVIEDVSYGEVADRPAGRRICREGSVVGAAGFEPAISCSQSTRVARLRHAPTY
jgi:hypothetical protein